MMATMSQNDATSGTAVPPDAALLHAVGLRATRPRLEVVAALREAPHATADDVVRSVRERLGSVSVQAVYDALSVLVRTDVARRVDPAGAPAARYELDVHDNHHHIVCTGCGVVIDVPCAVGHTACLTPAIDHGFALAESEVTYWGLCPQCQKTTAAAAAASDPREEPL